MSQQTIEIIKQVETAKIDEWTQTIFGYYALNIGEFGCLTTVLQHSSIQHHFNIQASYQKNMACQAIAESLPIKSDSVDLVILLHCLEFSAQPFQILQEIDRVLIADGRLIIAGFNPWRLFGQQWAKVMANELHLKIKQPYLISLTRIKDWLTLLGFDIEQQQRLILPPPLKTSLLKIMPSFSSIYLLQSVKRVSTLTPINPRWHYPAAFVRRPIISTAKNHHD